jgi:alpha-tubulin suppressor-like RCC1 family protein
MSLYCEVVEASAPWSLAKPRLTPVTQAAMVDPVRGVLAVALLAGCGRFGFDQHPLTSDPDAASDAVGDAPPPGWSHIIASDQTSCGIYLGRAYCWGRGTNREIGDGGSVDRWLPTAVALPAGTVTALAQGEGHGCAILDGQAYCWGSAPPGNGAPSSATPVLVSALPSPVQSIGCGGDFTCAVAAGTTYCWGVDSAGALGNGANTMTLPTPSMVTLPAVAVSIDAGNDHAMALLVGGSVWAWGHNDSGALGTGSMSPTQSDVPVQSLAAGAQPVIAGWHACMIDAGGALCWGLGTFGELGDGQATSSASPVQVSGMQSGVETIMTGGGPTDRDATCAVVAGEAYCWGSGADGRLGTGLTSNEIVPVRVPGLPADTVELALGYNHTCARSALGVVRCWGRGDLGQLGDGNGTSSLTPVLVPTP